MTVSTMSTELQVLLLSCFYMFVVLAVTAKLLTNEHLSNLSNLIQFLDAVFFSFLQNPCLLTTPASDLIHVFFVCVLFVLNLREFLYQHVPV